ncbi:MAG: DUF3267 domain-containing protein [Chloroflexi bacterium]|nr:DUF3267 domain-containing protein [Chloroflexota bacterium]
MPMMLKAALVAPGVIVHEFAHATFCRLAGVPIRRMTLFRIGSPAGFVTHALPPLLRQQLLIASGPLFLNTSLGVLALVFAWRLATLPLTVWSGLSIPLLFWLGVSILLESWPSGGDAHALQRVAVAHARCANVLAVLVLPLAWLLLMVNLSRRLWGHWAYALAMVWLARSLAGG